MSTRSWTFVLVGITLIAACSADPTSPLAIGSVQVVSGDGQSGTPGLPLNDTLTVKVLDQTGRSPMSGVPVQWSVQYGGGTFDRTADTTDVNGMARAVWTVGIRPGTNTASAYVGDLPGVTFSATGRGFQAIQVSVGFTHACALDATGQAWCWGSWGGGNSPFYVPNRVAGGHTFQQIAAGETHTCGLDTAGVSWCWGEAYGGALGNGATDGSAIALPVQVSGAPAFSQIATGDGLTTCGIAADSSAYCWGDNYYGQAGSGSTAAVVASPALVTGGLKFIALAPSNQHTCGIAADRSAWCWGLGANLGNGGGNSNVPVPVNGGHSFQSLSATDAFTCGFTTDAGPVCWGAIWNIEPTQVTPVREAVLAQLSEFAPGGPWSFGISGQRLLYIPGAGQVTASDADAPLPLHGLSGGYWSACALAQDGSVYCAGANDKGQLGNPDRLGYDQAYSTPHAVVAPPGY
ncbi:MAG TPA: hypothetical protein VFI39_00170 [Gemmatimonadales bacterium]|nr:hypothetical protein [Gemmatimonadales bacterium]